MQLTDSEQAILDGESGEGAQKAMELVVALGKIYTADGLVDITSAPIVASHSNSRALCGHSRNLTDKQFKVICNLGGLVGLNLYAPFLNESGKADFSDVKRHLEHFLELGGTHHLALGGDLDGCDALPAGFTGVESYNDLDRYLMQSGMEELTVNNVFNNNAVRFAMQHLQRKRVGG